MIRFALLAFLTVALSACTASALTPSTPASTPPIPTVTAVPLAPTANAGTATLSIDGMAVKLKTPLVVQEDAAAECDNFSFDYGTKQDIPEGLAVVWFGFKAKAPGLKPGHTTADGIKEPALDLTYHDPTLGPIELGTNNPISDRVWTPEAGDRVKGVLSYTVTPTIIATQAKSPTTRKVVYTYDFAFPPHCAAK